MFQSLKAAMANRPEYGTEQKNGLMNFMRGPDADMNRMMLMGIGSAIKGEDPTRYAQQLQGMRDTKAKNAALEDAMGGVQMSDAKKKILATLDPSQRAQYILQDLAQQEAQRRAAAAANAKAAAEAANLEAIQSVFAPTETTTRLDGVEGNPADIATGYGVSRSIDVATQAPKTPNEVLKHVLETNPKLLGNSTFNKMFDTYSKLNTPKQTDWKIEELADGRSYYVDPSGVEAPRLVAPDLVPSATGFENLAPEDVASLGLEPGLYQKNLETGRIQSVGGGGVNVTNNIDTKGQEAADKAAASEYIAWAQGGAADSAKNIAQLDVALSNLQSGKNFTGPVIGGLPDFVNVVAGRGDAINTREMVEEVVQRNLKAILGAQFTEKEGEKLIARAYNPRLSEEVNSRRLAMLIQQMKLAHSAKTSMAEYFQENQTLQGWEGKIPSIEDFRSINFDATSSDEEVLKMYGLE